MKPNPVSVVVSSNGTIYVVGDGSTANSVISISSNGAIDVVVSTSGRASNFYPASNSFMGFIGIIQGMAIDSADNLYLSDSFNHSIIKIEAGGGPLTLLAGGARLGTNNAPLIGSVDGQGEAARFNKPMGITIDSTGNLFVVNSGNGSIRKITPTGNVTTIATGYNIPQGIAIDSSGNLYITDTQDAIVSKLSYPTYTKTLMPISVPGWKPSTITIDSLGFFYITDSNTGNVFKFSKGCLAGSYLNGDSCELCAIGTWSDAGATSCTACPAGTTTTATGSTSSNQCTEISLTPPGEPCPDNASCANGPESFVCSNDYKKNSTGDGCEPCPTGTSGLNCTTVSPGYQMVNGRLKTCATYGTCPGGTGSNVPMICSNGYYNNGEFYCIPCDRGSYGSNGICLPCSDVPATNSTATWTTIDVAQTSCTIPLTCNPNYKLNELSNTCINCPKGSIGSNCTTIVPGYYVNNGIVQRCPSGSTCPGGSIDDIKTTTITCMDGWENTNSGCSRCPVGSYGTGGTCSNCSSFPATDSTATWTTNDIQGAISCDLAETCKTNFYLNNTTRQCDPCPSNATCEGGTASFVCATNYTKNETDDGCISLCPSNATCTGGSSSFVCNDGYMMNEAGNGCVKCPDGTEGLNCITTLGGYYKSGSTTLKCPSNASCPGGSESFVCSNGFIKNSTGDECVRCPAGSEGLNCTTILAGYYNNGTATLFCPSNATCAGGSASFVCADGYMMNESGDGCVKCPEGTEGQNCTTTLGGYYRSGSNSFLCPSNASCVGGLTSFVCSNNYIKNSTSNGCDPCPAGSEGLNCTTILRGYYNNGTTTLLCPSNATCAGGSASFVCDTGYMMNESGDGCVKCPDGTSGLNCTVALPGYYKNGANILKCPSNASCPGGSASFTCSNGYYVNSRTGTCDKVTLIVESRNTQLNNTAGTPTIADATSCTAAGCTLLFKDPTTGNMNPKNPCISEGNYYDFTTQKCINKCCAISMSNAKNDANCKYDVALGPLIKNTALCATKPSPCCINSSQANNISCKNYWSRGADSWTTQHNTKCAAGFTDYGIDSISEKRRKYRQLLKLGTWF
jgi:hypothetical protein